MLSVNLTLALSGVPNHNVYFILAIIIDELGKTVKLSKLLQWYGCDFGRSDEEILKTLSRYIRNGNQNLSNSIEEAANKGFKIIFHDYDWTLNSL